MADAIWVMDGHLGGYVEGGDPATQYPDMWAVLVETLGIESVIDVGCGDGVALRCFRGLGCRVMGVDGIPQDDPDIITHDYTVGPADMYATGNADFDLAWSCEFVEHVEERYVPNFLATFACARYVLMTHAEPGQQGYHHVNCQPADYWKGALAAIGYQYDETLTSKARRLAGLNLNPYNHFRRAGLAFRRAVP
jgi:hypothetical protein